MAGRKEILIRSVWVVFALICILCAAGCSNDSPEKLRYDMEKLTYLARKLAEQIDIQPDLAGAADSTALKTAYENILNHYYRYRRLPAVAADSVVRRQMDRLALAARLELARYYQAHQELDSVMAIYRQVGSEIPAHRDDMAGAALALARTYRSLAIYDSALAIYDRILEQYYPPFDYYGRVNREITGIPVDKIKIAQRMKNRSTEEDYRASAFAYYQRFSDEFPRDPAVRLETVVQSSRVFALNEQWGLAVSRLEQLRDSTGQPDLRAQLLIAYMCGGPLERPDRAARLYREIIDRHSDSAVIGSSLLRLGAVLIDLKRFDDARNYLSELKKKYEYDPRLMPAAQFYYAQSFRDENRWERALSEFQWLIDKYPYSEEAFRAARLIPEHFAGQGEVRLAEIWYRRMADYYRETAEAKSGRPLALMAYFYLADLERQMEQYEKSMEALDKILALSPRSRIGARALYMAAGTAYRDLHDSVRAQQYLDRLNRDFGTNDSTAIIDQNANDLPIETLD